MPIRACLLLALSLIPPTRADAAAPPPVRLDALGDPLPPGAVARLGTTRLRGQEVITSLAISPDSKLAATINDGMCGSVHIWDLSTGRLVGRIPINYSYNKRVFYSSDGTRLVF